LIFNNIFKDNTVYIWVSLNTRNQEENNLKNDSNLNNASDWSKIELKRFNSQICRLAWEENGDYLTVITADGTSFLFKEFSEGNWAEISKTGAEGYVENIKDK
jgi:WD40 repeat protein